MNMDQFDGWAAKAWSGCVYAGSWLLVEWKGASIIAFVAFVAGRCSA